jgi:hypothetical protein
MTSGGLLPKRSMINRGYSVRLSRCLLTSLVVVGCGSSGPRTHPSHRSAPTPKSTPLAIATPTPTPSSSAATVAVCQATAITGALGPSNGAAGTISYDLVLTNTGTQPCTLDGYPTLQLLADGQDLSTPQMDGVNWLASISIAPELVTIAARGGQASTVLGYSDAVDGGSPAEFPGATQLEIGLPRGGGTVSSGFTQNGYPIAPCHGSLRVYPITAGVANLNP